MSKHIDHWEEFVIKNDRETLDRFLKDYPEYTVKFDGAPAIICGFKEGKPLIATKSYFNKEPVYYTNLLELQESKLDGLKDKLIQVFEAFFLCDGSVPDVHPDLTCLMQGDLLWWNDSYYDDKEFRWCRPNIIEYGIPLEFIVSTQNVGVIWHTIIENNSYNMYDCTTKLWSDNFYCSTPVFFGKINPLFYEFTDLLCVQEALCKYLTYCFDNTVEPIIEVFCSAWYSNYAVQQCNKFKTEKKKRQLIDYYLPNGQLPEAFKLDLDIIQQSLNSIFDIKYQVLDQFQKETNIIKTRVNIDGQDIDCQHEGFCGATDERIVKFVNRYEFTKLNKDERVKRGWQLNNKDG